MRSVSTACFVGLCLSFAAIACDGDDAEENASAEATEVAPPQESKPSEAPAAATTSEPSAPSAPATEEPSEPSEPAVEPTDAGTDASKPKIPKPVMHGTLHATTSNGDTCIFGVDGDTEEDTGTSLDRSLSVGQHKVSCERADGSVAMESFVITVNATTNVVLSFPAPIIPPPLPPAGMGTLVAVAVGGSCAFSVNGMAKGSGATIKVPLKSGTYSVSCKPVSGATKSRSVTITDGGTAMAMFKL